MSTTRNPANPARKPDGPLRRGWTTGACAAAAAAAAFRAMLGDEKETVAIRLPKGDQPVFDVHRCEPASGGGFLASVIKDAGDDPDVTHGAEIISAVTPADAGSGIAFAAGPGVGTVTLAGLPVPVGEPAINPGPRAMIADALGAVAEEFDTTADVLVTVSIPGGETIAEKTMNPRLGIKGGLSILGTTGVVIPYSCASWINSIHRGVDVARELGLVHIVAATGSTSESAAMRDFADLPEQAFIDMGDFAGGLLKYLRRHPVPKLTFAGGAAKLTKLAQGHLDLHSKRSSADMAALAEIAAEVGADSALQDAIVTANTVMEAVSLCRDANVPIGDAIASRARETALAAVAGDVDVGVRVYDRTGELIGQVNADA